jgi:serine/threonine-protein kinase
MRFTIDELKILDGLLRQALELPPERRERWLEALPAEHARFAGVLRAHVADDRDGEEVGTADFLAAIPRLSAAGGAGAAGPALTAAGDRVGPWELVRPVGEGGMGTVWLARRADGAFQREVALKLPHRHLLDRGLAERMARERDILAALNDDRIARLYEAGFAADGTPFLALEFVQGTPIDAYCAGYSVTLEARVGLMAQVARAVAHAHANLVVHRDLKPSNILIASGGAAPTVKLLDFGVAKLLGSGGEPGAGRDLTRALGQALTPDYASPEQVLDLPLTTATDIYSLGVVLYQVACGEKPYAMRRQSAQALAEAIANADIVRPSRRAASGRRQGDARRIRGDLDAIILKALKARPEDRYPTASALADDLERFLARQPVLAQPDSLGYRVRRFVRRNALAVGAGATVALALLAGTGIAAWKAREARLEAAKTRAVKEFLVSLLAAGGAEQENAAARRKRPIGEVLMEAARTLPASLDGQPEVKSELQQTLGTLLEGMLLSEAAATVREARLRDLEAAGAPLAVRMQARTELAHSLGGTAEKRRALAMLDEVIASLGGARDELSIDVLRWALTSRAMLRNTVAGGQGALDDARRAVALAEMDEPGSSTRVYTLVALGAAHAANGNLAEAEAAFARALPLAAALKGDEAAVEGTVHSHLARTLFQYRHYLRAEEHAIRALAVIDRFSGRDSFVWARNAIYPGIVRGMAGDVEGATGYLERSAKVFASLKGDIDPEFASFARTLLAQALLEHGRPAQAREHAEAAWAPFRGATGEGGTPAPILRASSTLAQVLQAQGDYGRAGELLARAITLGEAVPGTPPANLFVARRLLALNHAYAGRHDAARSMLASVVAGDTTPGERFGAQRHFARIELAEVLAEGGRLEDAAREAEAVAAMVGRLSPDERVTAGAAMARAARLKGLVSQRRGDAAAAIAGHRQAIAILEPRHDPQSPFLARCRAELALALAVSGERAEARDQAERARKAFAAGAPVAPHLKRSLAEAERALAGPAR